MEAVDYKMLKQRFAIAAQWKDNWLALYQRIYMLVLPNRNALPEKYNYRSDGIPLTEGIYDSTAFLSAYQRGNDLHGLLLPKDRVWGRWAFNELSVDKASVANFGEKLDEFNAQIFSWLNQSNLSRAVAESIIDLNGGTAALYVYSKSDLEPLEFIAIPAINVMIENTFDDKIGTAWFRKVFNGVVFIEEFPNYKGQLLDRVKDNPSQQISVIYGQIKLSNGEYHLYAVPEEDMDNVLFASQKKYPQLLIFRDRVRPGEADGRGIALDLLPTIENLNTIVRDELKSMNYKANPPMFFDSEGFFNPYSVKQWAGAFLPRLPGGRNPLEALQMPSYPDVQEKIMDLRNVVRTGFQVDPLGEINQPVKSATEISVRENRAQRTSATDISRLINELPAQVFEVATMILMERGAIGKKTGTFGAADFKKYLKFSYQSPLYDLQKTQDITNFTQKNQLIQQFYGEGAVMASTNLGEVNDFLTDRLNLPYKLYKNEQQIMQIMQKINQASQPAAPTPTTAAQALPQMQAQGNAV